MVKVLGRFDPYNPISYIFCYKIVLMFYNGLRIKNRFNVFYTLLGVWFYLKFERWRKLFF